MNILVNRPTLGLLECIIKRSFTRTCLRRSTRTYDNDGKTTMHIMNKDQDFGLMIDGFSQVGFKLNNNMTILGPMIIFPRSVLAWNVGDISDVTEDSLSMFKILDPKIDILVLGSGDKVENHNLLADFIRFSRQYKIAFEILPTESACPTFNFLNAEGRNVVGAMIPPKTISYTEDDQIRSKMRYENVFIES